MERSVALVGSELGDGHGCDNGRAYVLVGIVLLFVLSVVLGSFFTVETAQVAIVQRLGKFARVAGPGLNWKTPFIEAVVRA